MTYNDPFGLLRLKKSAELAGGAFVSASPSARHGSAAALAQAGADATIELGLGYVRPCWPR